MIKKISLKNIAITFILVLTLSACHKDMKAATPIQDFDSPEWVIKGSGAFNKDKGKVFYGVGSVSGIKNPALKRTAAENRARAEVAKIFETYTASLMKDYAASTTAGDFSKTSEEQHVEQAIKTVVASTLSGVEIMDHWEHPARDEYFALARLDMETFKDNLNNMKELNSKVRDYVRENANKLHDELAKEEEKRGN